MKIQDGVITGKKRNGVLVSTEVPQELLDSLQKLLDEVIPIEEAMKEIALENASDEQALVLKDFYPFWSKDYINEDGENKYLKGTRVRYPTGDGIKLFEVEKDHKPQADWEPHLAVSLYKNLEGKIATDEEGNPTDEIPVWKEHVKYQFGEKVISPVDGKVYRSKFNGNNLWEPTTWPQGWEVESDY